MNKKTLSQLETIKEGLDLKIEERENTYDDRTERWQESERGEHYMEKTQELEEVRDNIDLAIYSLETYLDI